MTAPSMDTFLLAARIREVPGVATVRRWQGASEDRLYVAFQGCALDGDIYVDLRCGLIFGVPIWTEAPHELGERAVLAVQGLVESYRAGLPAPAGR